jgi:hypothetical protein
MNVKFRALLAAATVVVAVPQAVYAQSVVYDNGAINGTAGALSLVWGWAGADSFSLSSTTDVTAVTFGAWVAPGNMITAIDWGINNVSPPNFLSDGTAAILGAQYAGSNGGYDLYNYTFSIPTMTLGAGTYYLSLQNAASTIGGAVYWDINFGPSGGYSNLYGGVPSEAFKILGNVQKIGPNDPQKNAVPEPASWLMMLTGFGLAGAALRAHRRTAVTYAA